MIRKDAASPVRGKPTRTPPLKATAWDGQSVDQCSQPASQGEVLSGRPAPKGKGRCRGGGETARPSSLVRVAKQPSFVKGRAPPCPKRKASSMTKGATPVAKRTRGSGRGGDAAPGVTITTFMKKQRVPAAEARPSKQPSATSTGGAGGPNWEAAAEKAANSKFQPRPGIPKQGPQVPVVEGLVPRGASILIIQQPWIDLILEGIKSLEVRGSICNKKAGEKIYLALSGAGGYIIGSVSFVKCHGPFSRAEWTARAMQHCVGGDALPYGGNTFAWEFSKPQRFREPVPYVHKQGCARIASKQR